MKAAQDLIINKVQQAVWKLEEAKSLTSSVESLEEYTQQISITIDGLMSELDELSEEGK